MSAAAAPAGRHCPYPYEHLAVKTTSVDAALSIRIGGIKMFEVSRILPNDESKLIAPGLWKTQPGKKTESKTSKIMNKPFQRPAFAPSDA